MVSPMEHENAYDLFRRGSQLLAQHHPGAAAVVLERCLALEPGKASILEALGRAYFNQGAHARAAERFQTIVDHNPLEHYAHFGLGLCGLRTGDLEGALRTLRLAVVMKPDSEDYRNALADAEHRAAQEREG